MGVKLLHSADWHLDSPFGSLPETERLRLQQRQRQIPGLFADLCRSEGCDIVLLAGDLFDGRPSRETADLLKAALARCEVPVCIAPGNHDPYGPDSVWAETWPENVHIFTGGWEALDLPELPLRVYGAGYRSMDCPAMLADFQAEGSMPCAAVLHGDPTNPGSPCCPVTAAQVRESGLDYLAMGHIHRPGEFRAGDTLCAWPGCIMGRGWDETGEAGCLVVELDGTAQTRRVTLGLLRFHDLTADITGGAEAALAELLPPVPGQDLYRVTLTGEGTADLSSLQQTFGKLCYLELRDETSEPADPWAFAGEDSLQGVYFQLLQEQLADATEHRAQIVQLAAEISRRLLDGKEVKLP